MRSAFILIILVTISSTALAQTKVRKTPTTQPTLKSASQPAKSAADIISHGRFDAFLKKHVSETGDVDYKGIKNSPEAMLALNTYLAEIGSAKLKKSDTSNAALAFYINAYNAYVIKSVVDKYPIKSVMKVKGFFKNRKHLVAGKKMTLDALENKIIRKRFVEPRIHFVLVCAAKSCPILRPKAATAKNVEELMETAAKAFIPAATTVKKRQVRTSQLFNWFADDFKKTDGSVANYLAKYLPEHAELLKSGKAKIKFSKYDWKLNKK